MRKTIISIFAVLQAGLLFLSEQFGLGLDVMVFVSSLSFLVLYFLFELRLDIKRFKAQANKFKDPKFWLGLATVLIAAINEAFGWNLPITPEVLIAIMGGLMTVIFGKDFIRTATT